MADGRLTKKDLVALERIKIERRYDAVTRLGGLLIGRGFKWAFWVFLVYQLRVVAVSFAGKTTLTNMFISLGANVTGVVTASWATTAAFGLWVFFERRLRKGTTERLTLRNRDLELQLDRQRSSSELTPRGDTRPEDQV